MSQPYKVADVNLAVSFNHYGRTVRNIINNSQAYGRKEIEISEAEMPGLMMTVCLLSHCKVRPNPELA